MFNSFHLQFIFTSFSFYQIMFTSCSIHFHFMFNLFLLPSQFPSNSCSPHFNVFSLRFQLFNLLWTYVHLILFNFISFSLSKFNFISFWNHVHFIFNSGLQVYFLFTSFLKFKSWCFFLQKVGCAVGCGLALFSEGAEDLLAIKHERSHKHRMSKRFGRKRWTSFETFWKTRSWHRFPKTRISLYSKMNRFFRLKESSWAQIRASA